LRALLNIPRIWEWEFMRVGGESGWDWV
jgi:hypothetical protein